MRKFSAQYTTTCALFAKALTEAREITSNESYQEATQRAHLAGLAQPRLQDLQALYNAALEDLRWLAADNRNKPQNDRAGPTRALALLRDLMHHQEPQIISPTGASPYIWAWPNPNDTRINADDLRKYRQLADVMNTMQAKPEESQKTAQNALRTMSAHTAKIEKKSQFNGLPVTSFLRQMRGDAKETHRLPAQGRRGSHSVHTHTGNWHTIREGIPAGQPAFSKYEIRQHNIEAAAAISAKQINERIQANNITGALITKANLAEITSAELDKTPDQIAASYGLQPYTVINASNSLSIEIRDKIITDMGNVQGSATDSAYGVYFMNLDRDKQFANVFHGIVALKADLESDLQTALTGNPNRIVMTNSTPATTIKALDTLFEVEMILRKKQVQFDKQVLRNIADVPGAPHRKEILKKAIAEQEAVIAANEALSRDGEHGLKIAGQVVLSALGAIAGVILGAGVGAGATAGTAVGLSYATSAAAKEAITELIHGSTEKFIEEILQGNPVLIIAVIGCIIGLAGFIAGAALAAESSGRLGGGKEAVERFNKDITTLMMTEISQRTVAIGGIDDRL